MQEIYLRTRYFERGLLKTHKKVKFIFSFEQRYQKKKGRGTSYQSQFTLLFMHYLTKFDGVELFQKLHLQIYAS